jgi:hypothetical protein
LNKKVFIIQGLSSIKILKNYYLLRKKLERIKILNLNTGFIDQNGRFCDQNGRFCNQNGLEKLIAFF